MTTPQDQVPPPPKGYPSWLDYATEGPLSFSIHARAELAALRKELSDAKAERDERTMRYWSAAEERDAARKELSDTQGLLANARENLVAIDAQRAEAVREMEEAWKVADQCRQDRADVLTVHAKEGMLASEWVMRTATAERERDALRAQVAELREAILGLGELGCAYADGNELYLTDWNAQVAKLRAEPAPKALPGAGEPAAGEGVGR